MLFLANIRRAYKLAAYRPTKAISYAIDYLHHRSYGSKSTSNSKFCRGKKSGKNGKRSSGRWKHGLASKKKLNRKSSVISPVALIADKDGGPKVALIPINLFEEGQREQDAFREALSILALLRKNSRDVELFMESSNSLGRTLESAGPTITEMTEEDIKQLDREILEKSEAKQPIVESRYFSDGKSGSLEKVRVEKHLLPKSLVKEFENVSISGMQLNFEMNMTNLRDAILNPGKLREIKDETISDVGDSRMALNTSIQVYPEKGKTVPLQMTALIHGTVSIDPTKFSKEHLKRLPVSQFNEYVTAVAANLCSKALKKGFPMSVSRNVYTSSALNDSERRDSSFQLYKELEELKGESRDDMDFSNDQNRDNLSSNVDYELDTKVGVGEGGVNDAELDVLLSRNAPAVQAAINERYAKDANRSREDSDLIVENTERTVKATERNRRSAAENVREREADFEDNERIGRSAKKGIEAARGGIEADERFEREAQVNAYSRGKRFADRSSELREEEERAEPIEARATPAGVDAEMRRINISERLVEEDPLFEADNRAVDVGDAQEEPRRFVLDEENTELAPEYVASAEENASKREVSNDLPESVTESRRNEVESQSRPSEKRYTSRRWLESTESRDRNNTDIQMSNAFERDLNKAEEEAAEEYARDESENNSPRTRETITREDNFESRQEDEFDGNRIRLETNAHSRKHQVDELDRRIKQFLTRRKSRENESDSFRETQVVFKRNADALEKNAHALEKNADVLGRLVDALEIPKTRRQSSPNRTLTFVQSETDKSEIARQIEMSKRLDEKYADEKFEFSKMNDEFEESKYRDDDELATTFYGKIGLEDRTVSERLHSAERLPKDLEGKFLKLGTFKSIPTTYAIGLNTVIPGKGGKGHKKNATTKQDPHVVCVRKGAKGCTSPGLADNAPYVAKKTSARDTGSTRSGISLRLLECGLYQKAQDEAANKRRMSKCGRRSSCTKSGKGSSKRSSPSPSKPKSGGKKGSRCGSTPPCQNKSSKQKLPPVSSENKSKCEGTLKSCKRPSLSKSSKRSKSNDSCKRTSCSSKKDRSSSSSSKKSDPCKRSSSKSKDPCKRSSSKKKDPCKRSSSSSSKKSDPCKRSSSKSKDPCKRSSSSSSKKSDLCKRSSSKSKDPCKRSSSKSKRSSSKSKDPCKRSSSKSKDPCKRSSSSSSKKSDPCKRSSSKSKDPCKRSSSKSKRSSSKSKNPCKRSSSKSKDPCKRSSSKSKDPCKRSSSKSKRSSSKSKDPCKRSSSKSKDPCKRSSSKSKRSSSKSKNPCKRSSSKSKDPCKRSSSKSKDPCKKSSSSGSKKSGKCPVCESKRKFHSLASQATPPCNQYDRQVHEIVRCFSDTCPPKEGKTNYLPRNPRTNDMRKAICQKFSWRDDRKRRKVKKVKKNCYPDETLGMCPDTDCYRIFLKYEDNKRIQRKKRCARRKASSDRRRKGTEENKMGIKRNPFLLPVNCGLQQTCSYSSEGMRNEKAVIMSPHKVCKKKAPLKPIKDYDVRVCIDCVALSESDIHMFETGAKKYPNITLGNEASGVVQKVGKKVKSLKPGDHVALECGVPCGKCELCHSGRYNLCQQLTFRGCLKRYCTHPAYFCHSIIKRVPLSYASMTYQLSTGCNACRQAGIKPNSNVAIIGSCAMTLCTAMCARAMGCANICVICTTESTQDIVTEYITEKVVCIDGQTSVKAIYRMICDSLCTNPDTVINCLCSTKTMNAAIMALKPAGTCVVSGFLCECVAYNIMDALMKEIRIVPSFRSTNMFPFAIHLLERKQVPIDCLIADSLEWKDLQAGFEKALSENNCGPRKVIVQCREDDDEGDGNVGVKKNKLLIF